MVKASMLVGSFLITFALLSALWMLSARFLQAPAPTAVPTGTPYYELVATPPPATDVPAPTPTDQPTTAPTDLDTPAPETTTPTVAPTPSGPPATPVPLRTPPPSFALPSPGAGETQTIVVAGNAYSSSQVPDGGSIKQSGDGIVLETTTNAPDVLWVTYTLDAAALPPGAVVEKVDTRVCGQGDGQFWEVYGPVGSTPTEQEVSQPEADGCWHFTDAPGDDLSVIVSTMLESTMYIETVEYTVTLAQ
jgi:hypothetical protein